GKPKISNLNQSPGQFQGVQRVLVEIVAWVDHNPAFGDSMSYRELHPFGKESLDLRRDVGVVRPTAVLPWRGHAVRDHHCCALCRHHISPLRIMESAGVID